MRFRIAAVGMLALVSLFSGVVWAGRGLGTSGFAWPGYITQWHKGEGVADATRSRHALHLEKEDPNAPTNGFGAGVIFTGEEGLLVSELGFDVRNDGLEMCGLGVRYRLREPRRVGQTEGTLHEFFCAAGTLSPTPDNLGWTRVRFPQAVGLEIGGLALSFQLGTGSTGVTHLDDLDLNGTLIGKGGGGK